MIERLRRTWSTVRRTEQGVAVGWLVVGILIGAALVVFGIIKFLIPGE